MTAQPSSEVDIDAAQARLEAKRRRLPQRPTPPTLEERMRPIEAECPSEGCENRVHHLPRHEPRICEDCEQAEALERYRRAQEERAEAARQALAARADNVEQWLGTFGAPTRYRTFTRASWEGAYKPWGDSHVDSVHGQRWSLAEISEAWVEQADPLTYWLLVLYGKHGRRKTGFGTAVLGEAIAAGDDCLWLDAESFVDSLEWGIREPSRHDPNWRPWADVFKQAELAPRLLVDDLGAVRAGRTGARDAQDWWKERLTLLLRQREAWARPTIVTSNMEDLDELAYINHSLPSRLTVRLAFKIAGHDHRRIGKERST